MKKLLYTPNGIIKSCLRQLFLRSRERRDALKREKYTCQHCGKKQSKAKGKEVRVEVHHKNGISWDALMAEIRKYLLCPAEELEVLCEDCHKAETEAADVERHK